MHGWAQGVLVLHAPACLRNESTQSRDTFCWFCAPLIGSHFGGSTLTVAASWRPHATGFDFVEDDNNADDCDGHGERAGQWRHGFDGAPASRLWHVSACPPGPLSVSLPACLSRGRHPLVPHSTGMLKLGPAEFVTRGPS